MSAQNRPSPRYRGRPRGFDDEQALEVAMRSFWSQGYDGSSVDTMCRATGMSRASLYQSYGGKEGCFWRQWHITQTLVRLWSPPH